MSKCYIFVGEFSYALNWYAPLIKSNVNDGDVVVSFPLHEMLYRGTIDFHPLPMEMIKQLPYPSTFGQHIGAYDITPDSVIDYCKNIFPNHQVVIPESSNIQWLQNPPGKFHHLEPNISVEAEVDNFLSKVNRKSVYVMPKYRVRNKPEPQNWNIDNWKSIIEDLDKWGFEPITINIQSLKYEGGTYDGLTNYQYDIGIEDCFGLDKQSWLLKKTKASIWGSTGAVNLGFWLNTPTCGIILNPYHERLHFDWQNTLTDNHKKNLILGVDLSKVTWDDLHYQVKDWLL